MHTGLWWGNLNEGGCLEGTVVNGRIILKWIFDKWDGAWSRSVRLKTGTGGGLL
jgi:hypothetical protein